MKVFANLLGNVGLLLGNTTVLYSPWFLFEEAECPEEINQ